MGSPSKPLKRGSTSAFDFIQTVLSGDANYALDVDATAYHPVYGNVIWELLRLKPRPGLVPAEAHPNRYWSVNRSKYLRLWEIAQTWPAHLMLVNYADIHDDPEHRLPLNVVEVLAVSSHGIVDQWLWITTFPQFQAWYREFNQSCSQRSVSLHPRPATDPRTHPILADVPGAVRRFSSNPQHLIPRLR